MLGSSLDNRGRFRPILPARMGFAALPIYENLFEASLAGENGILGWWRVRIVYVIYFM